MELGKLDIDRSQWKRLTHVLSMRLSGSDSMFENDDRIKEIADEAITNYFSVQGSKSERTEILETGEFVNVDLSSVSASEVKSLGPELLATSFYDRLGMGKVLVECGFTDKEQALSKAVICSRLITPGSDLATWRYLGSNTALPELIDDCIANISKDPVYEIADALYENKAAIESLLVKRETELYPGARLFLFDLTNAYFEGRALGNDLAYYGHSKEKRYDCTLVSLALLVDDRGLPIYSRIYPGNQSEPETLADVLESIKDLVKLGLFTEDLLSVVMDRGIATKDNIALVQSYGLPYLVITRSDSAKKYLDEFKEDRNSFTEVTNSADETIYIKDASCNGGENSDINRVLCISERRGMKEKAISDQRTSRFIADVERLVKAVRAGTYVVPKTIERRIGKLSNVHRSISRRYSIEVVTNEDNKATDVILREKQDRIDEAKTLYGAYVIETNRKDLESEEIWHLYMTLTKVEGAFRALKSDLGLRPVHHQLARRTAAHLFISVLAYHLYSAISLTLSEAGDTRSMSTILTQLKTHSRLTVMLTDDKAQIHHLRISSTPDPVQRKIYEILGVKDPLKRQKKIVAQL
jgi:transposase